MLWKIVGLVLSTQCSVTSGAVFPLMQAPQFAPGAIIVPLGVQSPYGMLGNPAGVGSPIMPRDVAVHSHRHIYMLPRETLEDRTRKRAQEEVLRRNEERLKVAEAETSRLKSELEELKQPKRSSLRGSLGSKEEDDDPSIKKASQTSNSAVLPFPEGLTDAELDDLTTNKIHNFDKLVSGEPFTSYTRMGDLREKVVGSLQSIRVLLKQKPDLKLSIVSEVDAMFRKVIEHIRKAIEKAKPPPPSENRSTRDGKHKTENLKTDSAPVAKDIPPSAIIPPVQEQRTGRNVAVAYFPADMQPIIGSKVPAESALELDVLESVRVVLDSRLQSVQKRN